MKVNIVRIIYIGAAILLGALACIFIEIGKANLGAISGELIWLVYIILFFAKNRRFYSTVNRKINTGLVAACCICFAVFSFLDLVDLKIYIVYEIIFVCAFALFGILFIIKDAAYNKDEKSK